MTWEVSRRLVETCTVCGGRSWALLKETGEEKVSLHNAHVLFDDDRLGPPGVVDTRGARIRARWTHPREHTFADGECLVSALGLPSDPAQFALIDLDWVPLE